MSTSRTSTTSRRMYYPQNRTTMLVLGVVNGFAATLIAAATISSSGREYRFELGDLVFLLPLTISMLCFALGLSARLVVTPEALVFQQLGVRAFTPWSNLLHIGPPPGGAPPTTLLHLRAPAVIDWAWLAAGYRDQILAFPLVGYAFQPGTALRVDLERYAPHLVELR